MAKLVQHITNFLNRVQYKEIRYPEDSVDIDDDFEGLRELREMIYTSSSRPVLLTVYNMSTKMTIDLYLAMKPPFQLIIQSPIALYSDDEVTTVYNNDTISNTYMLHHITPHYSRIYDEAYSVIDRLGVKKVAILGPHEGEKDGIHYISDLSDIVEGIELVIDTMLNNKHEYVNFVESIDRATSFKNVIYYRLMDVVSFEDISMGKKVDIGKIIMEALEHDKSFEKYFSKEDIEDYRRRTKDITSSEKSRMLTNDLNIESSLLLARSSGNYINSYLAILFSDYKNLRDMIEYPPPTDDLSFNRIDRYRVTKLLKEKYGTGLMFYVAVLLNTLEMLEESEGILPEEMDLVDRRYDLYRLLIANNINARLFVNIVSRVKEDPSKGHRDNISIRIRKIAVELLKIYGGRELKLIANNYYDGNNKYNLDTYYTLQDLSVKSNTINPIVVDENNVYLWI